MSLRSGELFAGVGGLGMAVDDVFGSDPAWFCEFDAAPSRVLAHHFADVPNYGDVTKVDWATAPHVDILAGGFPCQDVSLAGARRGMKDGTRSGLWSEYVKAIDTLRPDWVVIENVRGLISARADSEVEPCPWCVGDGDDEYHLRALDAVLADLSRLGFDAEWTGLRAADVGAPHGRFRFFILAWPAERTTSSDASRMGGGRRRGDVGSAERAIKGRPEWDAEWVASVRGGADALSLLPTPVAQPSGNTPSEHLRKKPGREVVTDLSIIAENGLISSGGRLLPTPRTTDMNGAGAHGDGGPDLRTAVTLLPTPTVGNATGGNAQRGGDRGAERLLPGIAVDASQGALMPTPRASRGGSATETMYGLGAERDDEGDRQGNVTGEVSSWGPYAAAIARWEAVVGRIAPAPVRMDGKNAKARLNPELTEWMMGWPAGWVTASAQLSRSEQLKACGNGVVPQQAAAALRMLLARPGVPAIREVVAA